jgi:WD40 repeat protein
MTDHSDAVWCVRFSPDGAALAAASADRSVSLFNFA